MVGRMPPSSALDASPTPVDATPEPVRLRVDVYDALARRKGHESVAAQAAWHGISVSQLFNLRAGRSMPGLDTAMRMAADLGVPVEVIWERVTS